MSTSRDHTPERLPIVLLNGLLGGLSVLNLIQDFNWVTLYGKVKSWIEAYDFLVQTIGGYCLGWIHWFRVAWIHLSHEEMHLLVLCIIVARIIPAMPTVTYTTTWKMDPAGEFEREDSKFAEDWGKDSLAAGLLRTAGWMVGPVLMTALLPGNWGLIATMLYLGFTGWILISPGYDVPERFAAEGQRVNQEVRRRIRSRLISVICWLVIILLLNFAFFRQVAS